MNDQQLEQWFRTHKQEIPDHDFTKKVMHQLPDRKMAPPLVWIFAAIGTFLFFAFVNVRLFIDRISLWLENSPWWTLPVASTTLVVVFLIGFYFHEQKDDVTIHFKGI
ncbi:MAG: DUF5056 domain-containing protein [Microbacter sp.]